MTELAPNQLHSVSVSAAYVADPLALFTQLTTPHDNSLLLESAEIDTKAGTQSLLLIDACVRLVCNGLDVTATALNHNGTALLDCLQSALPPAVAQERVRHCRPDWLTGRTPTCSDRIHARWRGCRVCDVFAGVGRNE